MRRKQKVMLAIKPSVKKSKPKASARPSSMKSRGRSGARSSEMSPFAAFGGLAGSMLGGPAGGALGMAAGSLISRITGYGAYKVQKNTVSNGNSVPTFRNGGDGMRVCHREFLFDLTGSVGFVNKTNSINPGLLTSFPWLSLLAADFEEYDMNGLVFEYRASSGTAVSATSAALGVVILATDYDAVNPQFTTKQQMESYEYSTSTVPFTGCIHPVECARSLNVLSSQYVRTGTIPPNADLRLYDIGNFQVATQGMQSAYVVGEIWVSYDVVFRKPRLPPQVPFAGVSRFHESPNGSASSANPFGSTGAVSGSDNGLKLVPFGTGSLIIPAAGVYAINFVAATATPITALALAFGASISLGPILLMDNVQSLVSSFNTTTRGILTAIVTVSSSGLTVANTFTITSTGFTAGSADCIVTLLGPSPLSLPAPLPNVFCALTVTDETPRSDCECKKNGWF